MVPFENLPFSHVAVQNNQLRITFIIGFYQLSYTWCEKSLAGRIVVSTRILGLSTNEYDFPLHCAHQFWHPHLSCPVAVLGSQSMKNITWLPLQIITPQWAGSGWGNGWGSNQYILSHKPMTSVSDAVPTLNHHLLLIHGLSNITKIPTITTCVVGIMEESFVFGVEVLFPIKGYTAQQRYAVLYLKVTYHPLYSINKFVTNKSKLGHKCFLIWGDCLSCDPLR